MATQPTKISLTRAMALGAHIPVQFGSIKGKVFGGPFHHYVPGTRRLVGVKMAQEVSHPCDCSVPTKDFSVPDMADMQRGILFGLQQLALGNDIYAGCMGGIGRTGLYMACMAKVMRDFQGASSGVGTPIAYVRQHYMAHAVETQGQKDFVAAFDTAPALKWLTFHHTPPVRTVERVVYTDRVVYKGPVAWALHQLSSLFK